MGFVIPDLLINLLSFQGFLKNNYSVVILKCPNGMFGYYFNKGFVIFDCDKNDLEKFPSDIKDIIGAEVSDNSYKVMICSIMIPST